MAYANDWRPVLAAWDEGDFTMLRPNSLMPFGGVFQTISWSRTRAEAKQAELIGMTTASSSGTSRMETGNAIELMRATAETEVFESAGE